MKSIRSGIHRFREEVFPARRQVFEALAGGQKPELLLVTCSDSRIDPALLTQTEPGQIFVIRNAGNLVCRHGEAASGEAATVEYGVRVLGIRDIAVCGHTSCGAMAALGEAKATDSLPSVRAWLSVAEGALTREPSVRGFDDPLTRLVAANVLTQLDHLRTHPCVAEGEAAGSLRLHAWVYDFVRGQVFEADAAGHFRPLASREVAA